MTGNPPSERDRGRATLATMGRPEAPRDDAARATAARLDAAIGFRLGRAYRAVRAGWESRIADLGLTGPQAGALRAVAEHPGLGLRELGRRLGTDPMNAKRLADGLEAAGLVSSSADPDDRRRRGLRPTDAGAAMALEVGRRSADWSRTVEAIVGREDTARLWRILARLEAGIADLGHDPADDGPVAHG